MKKLLFAAAALCATSAFADDIYLGQPGYGGNGCPQGSASAVLSPDHKTLTVLFDQYAAEAGRTTGRTVDRKSCNLAIPVHVPNGMSMSLIKVDYRGFNALPAGGSSRLSVGYFFAGQQGPTYQKSFYGPLNSNYLASNDLIVGATSWSPCGKDTNLRINTSMMAQTNSRNDQALSTVDSADIRSGLIYHLQFRSCR